MCAWNAIVAAGVGRAARAGALLWSGLPPCCSAFRSHSVTGDRRPVRACVERRWAPSDERKRQRKTRVSTATVTDSSPVSSEVSTPAVATELWTAFNE